MSYNPPPPDFNPPPYSYASPTSNDPASPLAPVKEVRPNPTPAIANLCFFVGVMAFLTFSVIAQLNNWGFFLTSTIGELALALTAIFFCVMGRYSFKETFSLRRLDLWNIFLCVLIGFVGQFAVRFPTALNQWIMQIFGPFTDNLFPNPPDLPGRLLFFFAVVVFGPLCEETLNRGFVLAGYRHLSFWKCIFFVGLLFGLFHLYPFRFAYTFLLGMTLAYLVLVTGSLWSSIAAHVGFNLLGGFSPWLLDIINQMAKDSGQKVVSGEGDIDLSSLLATIPISLIAGGIFLLLMRAVTKRMAKRRSDLEVGYLGLARNIRPDLASGSTPTGLFFGPNKRYTYSRYGYERSDTTFIHPSTEPEFAPPTQNQAQLDNSTASLSPEPINSPYMTPQGFVPPNSHANYPVSPVSSQSAAPNYSAEQPNYTWDNPPAPLYRLSPQSSRWWKLSFILIFLFYFYTAATEISIRLKPDKTVVPKTPSSQVQPRQENGLIGLKYYSVR